MRTSIPALIATLAVLPGDALRQASETASKGATEHPFLTSEILFPLEHWHNHASMIVELPDGDLLTCWFHGSGERTADDVLVPGARLKNPGLGDARRGAAPAAQDDQARALQRGMGETGNC